MTVNNNNENKGKLYEFLDSLSEDVLKDIMDDNEIGWDIAISISGNEMYETKEEALWSLLKEDVEEILDAKMYDLTEISYEDLYDTNCKYVDRNKYAEGYLIYHIGKDVIDTTVCFRPKNKEEFLSNINEDDREEVESDFDKYDDTLDVVEGYYSGSARYSHYTLGETRKRTAIINHLLRESFPDYRSARDWLIMNYDRTTGKTEYIFTDDFWERKDLLLADGVEKLHKKINKNNDEVIKYLIEEYDIDNDSYKKKTKETGERKI